MERLIKAFKALADETRLRILKLLIEREYCVCEVMQALEISQTRASRNLSLLRDAGLLLKKRDGLRVVYAIDENRLQRYGNLLLAVINAMDDNEVIVADRERAKHMVRVGPGCYPAKDN